MAYPLLTTLFPSANSAVSGSWTTPENGYTEDDSCATVTIAASNTSYERDYENFNIDISGISHVSAIVDVDIELRYMVSTAAGIAYFEVIPYLDGVAGAVLSNSSEPLALTWVYWENVSRPGGGAWRRSDFLNGRFKLRIRARSGNSATSVTYSLDAITIYVTSRYFNAEITADCFPTSDIAISGSWTNPTGVQVADDDSWATVSVPPNTSYQRGQGNFGIDDAIPADTTGIVSVWVRWMGKILDGGYTYGGVCCVVNDVDSSFSDEYLYPDQNSFWSDYSEKPGGGAWTRDDLLDGVFETKIKATLLGAADADIFYFEHIYAAITYTTVAECEPVGDVLVPTDNAAVSGTWNNPEYAYVDDVASATVVINTAYATYEHDYLAFEPVSAVIPDDAVIDAVILSITIKCSTTSGISYFDATVYLDDVAGDTLTVQEEPTYFGTWKLEVKRPGGGAWTRADLYDSSFKVRVAVRSGDAEGVIVTFYWTYISIDIWYYMPFWISVGESQTVVVQSAGGGGFSISEAILAGESQTKVFGTLIKSQSEAILAGESQTVVVQSAGGGGFSISEAILAGESQTKVFGTLIKSQSEAILAGESQTKVFGTLIKSQSEAILAGESQTKVFGTLIKSQSEAILAGESQTKVFGTLIKSQSEAILATETQTKLVGTASLSISDPIIVGEALVINREVTPSIAEGCHVDATVYGIAGGLIEAISESIPVVETQTKIITSVASSISESIVTTELRSLLSSTVIKSHNEPIIVAETPTVVVSTGPTIVVNITDEVTTVTETQPLAKIDAVILLSVHPVTLFEAANGIAGGVSISISELAIVGETQTKLIGTVIEATSDSIVVGESQVKIFGALVRVASEPVSASESQTLLEGTVVAATSDAVAIGETQSISQLRSVSISESILASGIPSVKSGAVLVSIVETSIVFEAQTQTASLSTIVAELVILSELATGKVNGLSGAVSELVTASESRTVVVESLTESIVELVTVADPRVILVGGLIKSVPESLAVTEVSTVFVGEKYPREINVTNEPSGLAETQNLVLGSVQKQATEPAPASEFFAEIVGTVILDIEEVRNPPLRVTEVTYVAEEIYILVGGLEQETVESTGITESITVDERLGIISATEVVSTSEAKTVLVGALQELVTEAVVATESTTVTIETSDIGISEIVSVVEVPVALVGSLVKSISEPSTVLEAQVAALSLAGVVIFEPAVVVELASGNVGPVIVGVAEVLSVLESQALTASVAIDISEPVTVFETVLGMTGGMQRAFVDAVSVSEAPSVSLLIENAAVVEPVGVADVLVGRLVGTVSKAISELVSVFETQGLYQEIGAEVFEGILATETRTGIVGASAERVTEPVVVFESITIAIETSVVSVFELVTTTEVSGALVGSLVKSISEPSTVLEAQATSLALAGVVISEPVVATESALGSVGTIVASVVEAVSVSESQALAASVAIEASEPLVVFETVLGMTGGLQRTVVEQVSVIEVTSVLSLIGDVVVVEPAVLVEVLAEGLVGTVSRAILEPVSVLEFQSLYLEIGTAVSEAILAVETRTGIVGAPSALTVAPVSVSEAIAASGGEEAASVLEPISVSEILNKVIGNVLKIASEPISVGEVPTVLTEDLAVAIEEQLSVFDNTTGIVGNLSRSLVEAAIVTEGLPVVIESGLFLNVVEGTGLSEIISGLVSGFGYYQTDSVFVSEGFVEVVSDITLLTNENLSVSEETFVVIAAPSVLNVSIDSEAIVVAEIRTGILGAVFYVTADAVLATEAPLISLGNLTLTSVHSVGASEAQGLVFGTVIKEISESVSASEARVVDVRRDISILESASAGEYGAEIVGELFGNAFEQLLVAETSEANPETGGVWISEKVTVSEEQVGIVGYLGKALLESATASEFNNVEIESSAVAVVEQLSVGEVATRLVGTILGAVVEAVPTAEEATSKLGALFQVVVEPVAAYELQTEQVGAVLKQIAESVLVAEDHAVNVEFPSDFNLEIGEAVSVSESGDVEEADLAVLIDQGILISDIRVGVVSTLQESTAQELVSVLEFRTGTVGLPIISRTDSIIVVEEGQVRHDDLAVGITEGVGVGEAKIFVVGNVTSFVAEPAQISEEIYSKIGNISGSVFEPVLLSETFGIVVEAIVSTIVEQVSVLETKYVEIGTSISAFESLLVTELAIEVLGQPIQFVYDSTAVSDEATIIISVGDVSVFDVAALSDFGTEIVGGLRKQIAESLVITESEIVEISVAEIGITDGILVAELVAGITTDVLGAAYEGVLVLDESTVKTGSLTELVAETVFVAELQTKVVGAALTGLSESVLTLDAATVEVGIPSALDISVEEVIVVFELPLVGALELLPAIEEQVFVLEARTVTLSGLQRIAQDVLLVSEARSGVVATSILYETEPVAVLEEAFVLEEDLVVEICEEIGNEDFENVVAGNVIVFAGETLSLFETSSARISVVVASATETIFAQDAVSVLINNVGEFALQAEQNIFAVEEISLLVGLLNAPTVGEGIGLAEEQHVSLENLAIPLSEPVTSVESFGLLLGAVFVTRQEAVGLLETVSLKESGIGTAVEDSAQVADSCLAEISEVVIPMEEEVFVDEYVDIAILQPSNLVIEAADEIFVEDSQAGVEIEVSVELVDAVAAEEEPFVELSPSEIVIGEPVAVSEESAVFEEALAVEILEGVGVAEVGNALASAVTATSADAAFVSEFLQGVVSDAYIEVTDIVEAQEYAAAYVGIFGEFPVRIEEGILASESVEGLVSEVVFGVVDIVGVDEVVQVVVAVQVSIEEISGVSEESGELVSDIFIVDIIDIASVVEEVFVFVGAVSEWNINIDFEAVGVYEEELEIVGTVEKSVSEIIYSEELEVVSVSKISCLVEDGIELAEEIAGLVSVITKSIAESVSSLGMISVTVLTGAEAVNFVNVVEDIFVQVGAPEVVIIDAIGAGEYTQFVIDGLTCSSESSIQLGEEVDVFVQAEGELPVRITEGVFVSELAYKVISTVVTRQAEYIAAFEGLTVDVINPTLAVYISERATISEQRTLVDGEPQKAVSELITVAEARNVERKTLAAISEVVTVIEIPTIVVLGPALGIYIIEHVGVVEQRSLINGTLTKVISDHVSLTEARVVERKTTISVVQSAAVQDSVSAVTSIKTSRVDSIICAEEIRVVVREAQPRLINVFETAGVREVATAGVAEVAPAAISVTERVSVVEAKIAEISHLFGTVREHVSIAEEAQVWLYQVRLVEVVHVAEVASVVVGKYPILFRVDSRERMAYTQGRGRMFGVGPTRERMVMVHSDRKRIVQVHPARQRLFESHHRGTDDVV